MKTLNFSKFLNVLLVISVIVFVIGFFMTFIGRGGNQQINNQTEIEEEEENEIEEEEEEEEDDSDDQAGGGNQGGGGNGSQPMFVNVYFNDLTNDPNLIDCDIVYPTQRAIPQTLGIGMAALEQLILGPESIEVQNGMATSIPNTAAVNSLSISNGIAYVDVSASFYQVGGACSIVSTTASITQTLTQFETVNSVEITVDGVDIAIAAQP